jgi:hypothetical protein
MGPRNVTAGPLKPPKWAQVVMAAAFLATPVANYLLLRHLTNANCQGYWGAHTPPFQHWHQYCWQNAGDPVQNSLVTTLLSWGGLLMLGLLAEEIWLRPPSRSVASSRRRATVWILGLLAAAWLARDYLTYTI